MAVLAQPGDRRGRLIVGAADGVVKARANENKPLMQPPYVATGAAARSSANTSPHCGRAPPNRSGPTSPARGRSPPGFMRPREILTESQGKRLLGVRLACPDITCACDLARAFADLCVTGADTCYWSGFARPKRTHGSRCRASPASSARTSTPSPPASPPVEFWRRRRTREPGENTQASDVWLGLVRTPTDPHPHPAMSFRYCFGHPPEPPDAATSWPDASTGPLPTLAANAGGRSV